MDNEKEVWKDKRQFGDQKRVQEEEKEEGGGEEEEMEVQTTIHKVREGEKTFEQIQRREMKRRKKEEWRGGERTKEWNKRGKKKDKFRREITFFKRRQTEGIVRGEKEGGEKSKKAALVRQQVYVFCLSTGKQKKTHTQTFDLWCNKLRTKWNQIWETCWTFTHIRPTNRKKAAETTSEWLEFLFTFIIDCSPSNCCDSKPCNTAWTCWVDSESIWQHLFYSSTYLPGGFAKNWCMTPLLVLYQVNDFCAMFLLKQRYRKHWQSQIPCFSKTTDGFHCTKSLVCNDNFLQTLPVSIFSSDWELRLRTLR